MNQPSSREAEPSAFAYIFGAVLASLGVGAAIWGATKGRTGRAADSEGTAHTDGGLTANTQQPSGSSMPDA